MEFPSGVMNVSSRLCLTSTCFTPYSPKSTHCLILFPPNRTITQKCNIFLEKKNLPLFFVAMFLVNTDGVADHCLVLLVLTCMRFCLPLFKILKVIQGHVSIARAGRQQGNTHRNRYTDHHTHTDISRSIPEP